MGIYIAWFEYWYPSLLSTPSLPYRWFFSQIIKREDAEKQLKLPFNSYGSYLVRKSENTTSGYALSVRDRDNFAHYKISQLENGEFFIIPRSRFKTLQDLVIYYQQQADGLCVNLKKPCVNPTDISRDEWQIDKSDVRFVKKLTPGEFTEVWEGVWNNTTPVAVKILKPKQKMTVDEFLQPANLMMKLQHPKLVQLYGLCSKEEPVLIITEFMEHGNLLEYLHCGEKSLNQLVDMASQVAAGMAYLEKKNVVHRDLQASNVLVGVGPICKLAIFKLARVMHQDVYEGQEGEKIAIKWVAPEATLHNKFSIK